MKYIAIAGRQSLISLAEIQSLYDRFAKLIHDDLIIFEIPNNPEASKEAALLPKIDRLGGALKLGKLLDLDFSQLPDYLMKTRPTGKITFGISDYSKRKNINLVAKKSMEVKHRLTKAGRSVRIINGKNTGISSATAHHNQLGEKPGCFEFLLVDKEIYLSLGTQNITAYTERDRARPARDAKVGMLPPKLAQILINLCGNLPKNARILDPFCGTGVVLQEAAIMGYSPYGSDLDARMVEYSKKNLAWLLSSENQKRFQITVEDPRVKKMLSEDIVVGDATSYQWQPLIDAVAFEGFLGAPMSNIPIEIKFKTEKTRCKEIILSFLKNITPQIKSGTPIVMAVPAWLRESGKYARLNILDEIQEMGYNFKRFQGLSQSDLLYYREGQIVAREIIVLRKR